MSASGGGGDASGTAVAVSAVGANAALSVVMPAVAGKTNYVSGFEVTGDGATAGAVVDVTINNVAGTNLHYAVTVPAGALVGITPLIIAFNPPLVAQTPNSTVTLTVPAFGAGNTNVAAVLHGYVQ